MLLELQPNTEIVTAVLTSHMQTGENFEGAIVIGVYRGDKEEIWVDSHGVRSNIHVEDVDGLCKQLRRAAKIAKEQPGEE